MFALARTELPLADAGTDPEQLDGGRQPELRMAVYAPADESTRAALITL